MIQTNEALVTGIWKFHARVDPAALALFAEGLKQGTEGSRYEGILCVRKCSKDQHGLCFSYRLDTEQSSEEYVEHMKDSLYREFGSGLVGWDISHRTWIIS